MANVGRSVRDVIAAGLAAFLALSPIAVSAQGEASWPSLQGGPEHLGSAPVGAPAPPLEVAWESAIARPAGLSPAVVAGNLAISTARSAVIGFDPATGEERWRVARAGGSLSTPALDPTVGVNGVVVFTQGADRTTSGVVALDLGSHEQVWRYQESDRQQPRGPFDAAPTIADGIVFLGAKDGFVFALNAVDGHLRWKFQTGARVATSIAVGDGRAFAVAEDVGTGRSTLFALDATTGKRLWDYSPPDTSVHVGSPTVIGGAVYEGFGDGAVRAFDARDGAVRWTAPVRGVFDPLIGLAASPGGIYAEDVTGSVYRFDAATGDRRWDYQFPSISLRGSPLLVGADVYVGLGDGTVGAIDTQSGDLIWHGRLGSAAIGALTPAGDLLLAPSAGAGGRLTGLRRNPNGRLVRLESPTKLHLGRALANFGAGFGLVLAGLLTLFQLALLRRRRAARGVVATEAVAPPRDDA